MERVLHKLFELKILSNLNYAELFSSISLAYISISSRSSESAYTEMFL